MIPRLVQGWRAAQRCGSPEVGLVARKAFSEAGPSTRVTSASEASSSATPSTAASRLFENVQAPPELGASGGGEAGPSSSWLSTLGNGLFFGSLGFAGFLGYYTYRYTSDQVVTMVEETRKPENSFPGSSVWVELMDWYVKQRQRLESEIKKYSDPPSDCLLPDLPPQARHVRTLVLDLDDTLVHSDWTRGRGWRTFKRPGAEDFIKQMAQYYELVVYTHQLPTYADPILDRLDPNRYIGYRLYRDSTQYLKGKHVRDLSKLNRDLAKVLLVTASDDAYSLQPENAIKLKAWKKEAQDTTLLDLMPFLELVFRTNVPDVREVVRSYEGQDIPAAFRERMRAVQEQQRQKAGRGFFSSLKR